MAPPPRRTGLSSSDATQIMDILSDLARARQYTIVCSIHQVGLEQFSID
jgi:ABC-type phosphate/phosphonate transport system ATPase subunit